MTGQSWGREQPHHHQQHADERDELAVDDGPDGDDPSEGVMRELLRESVEGIEPVDPIPLDPSEGA